MLGVSLCPELRPTIVAPSLGLGSRIKLKRKIAMVALNAPSICGDINRDFLIAPA
jgi:hypothetical protein